MWDVLSYDWVNTIAPEDVLKNVNDNSTNGSIVVFHDSLKAEKNLRYALPLFIESKLEKGFRFACL
jgi:peptidoglycan/xylan/chitin deacetylase (PgdA/CDA1 family)